MLEAGGPDAWSGVPLFSDPAIMATPSCMWLGTGIFAEVSRVKDTAHRTMPDQLIAALSDERQIATRWLADLGQSFARHDAGAVARLFTPDGHWRDVVAFTWTIATHSGRAAIERALQPALATMRPVD